MAVERRVFVVCCLLRTQLLSRLLDNVQGRQGYAGPLQGVSCRGAQPLCVVFFVLLSTKRKMKKQRMPDEHKVEVLRICLEYFYLDDCYYTIDLLETTTKEQLQRLIATLYGHQCNNRDVTLLLQHAHEPSFRRHER